MPAGWAAGSPAPPSAPAGQAPRAAARERSPFCDPVPSIDARGAVWVRPEVVVEARMLGLTRDGRLRQPAYLDVRSDLTAEDLMADAMGGDPQ